MFLYNFYEANKSDIPPSLISILNSMVNYGKETKVSTMNLAEEARQYVFDFNYPLSVNVSRETFETDILNHYMTRRINYDTFTLFKLNLRNKLVEIMPKYNIMFNALNGWDIFKGSTMTRELEESTANTSKGSNSNNTTNTTNTTATGSASGSNSNTGSTTDKSDRRYSDTPQAQLEDVQNGDYLTTYNYDSNTGTSILNGTTSSTESSTSTTTNTNTTTGSNDTDNTGNRTVKERVINERENETELLLQFQQEYVNIYSMIFAELDSLFYGLC